MDVEVAQKSKLRGSPSTSVPLPERIRSAVSEGRFQHALELARHLYKQDPSEQHLALLRDVSFKRGQQLQKQGHLTEAVTVFSNAAKMAGPPEFQRQLVEHLTACGAAEKAIALADRLQNPALKSHLAGMVADQAVRQGKASLVSAELKPQYDAIMQAFAQLEKGQDEQARASLQAIGLQSPFIEWRVLIRGFLAYYSNDDARALENWQRLNAARLPARLAAPYRFSIDPAFRAVQPPETQNALRKHIDRLQGSGLTPGLRAAQSLLSQTQTMAQGLRQIEGLLSNLRLQAPDLVPRFASCVRWAIIEHGEPEDLARFLRVFGQLPDDPRGYRTAALAMERHGDWLNAHETWQEFDKDLAENRAGLPADHVRHLRALLWTHLGEIAADNETEESDDDDDLMDFLPFPGRKKNNAELCKPAAQECFKRSLELAPEALKAHEALFQYHVIRGQHQQAAESGQRLLDRFPDHAATLEAMGMLAMNESRFDEARNFFQRALRINPLDRRLRIMLGKIHEYKARELSCSKQFDEARAECASATALYGGEGKLIMLSLAAILEMKAKKLDRHQELLAEIEKIEPHRLLIAHALLCEGIRQKLSAAQKKPFSQEFERLLAEAAEPNVVPRLIVQLLNQRLAGPAYRGQKTHEKMVLALIEKVPLQNYPEEVMEALCSTLADLNAVKPLQRCFNVGRRRFPNNPRLALIDAEYILKHSSRRDSWRLDNLLRHARKLIEALPRGERHQQLQTRLEELEEQQRDQGGPGQFFNSMMNSFFDMDDDEEYR